MASSLLSQVPRLDAGIGRRRLCAFECLTIGRATGDDAAQVIEIADHRAGHVDVELPAGLGVATAVATGRRLGASPGAPGTDWRRRLNSVNPRERTPNVLSCASGP